MPTLEEIDYYLSKEKEIIRPDLDDHLNHLHRVTSREREWKELFLLAFDELFKCFYMPKGGARRAEAAWKAGARKRPVTCREMASMQRWPH